jgi:hypothetical protein
MCRTVAGRLARDVTVQRKQEFDDANGAGIEAGVSLLWREGSDGHQCEMDRAAL